MKIEFIKMHGAGNDYVYIDCVRQRVQNPGQLSTLISDRHKGIGADGLVLISPSDIADVRMRMFNADGSEGNMCGNAIRCVAKYVYDGGYAKQDIIKVETKSGIKTIQINSKNGRFISAAVDMGKAVFTPSEIPMNAAGESFINQLIDIGGTAYRCTAVSMGNPHCVTFVDDLENLEIEKIGPRFENNPIFPDRVNTEFIKVIDAENLEMRVWERGSGETMACGTGSCAAVAAAVALGICKAGTPVNVHLRGGVLTDRYMLDGTVIMEGGANTVFTGIFDTEELSDSFT